MAGPGNGQMAQNSDQNTVTIRITNSIRADECHTIPRALLQISPSPVLRVNPQTQLITFQFNGPANIFSLYKTYLRTRTIEPTTKAPNNTTTRSDYDTLINCWGMALTLRDSVYADTVTSSIISRLRQYTGSKPPPLIYTLTAKTVAAVYGGTAPDTPLRRLMTDAAAHFGRVDDFRHFSDDAGYPALFIKDLMVELGRVKEAQEQRLKRSDAKKVHFEKEGFAEDECVYHVHRQTGKPCWRAAG